MSNKKNMGYKLIHRIAVISTMVFDMKTYIQIRALFKESFSERITFFPKRKNKEKRRKNLFEQPSFKWVPLSFATWWLLFG